MRLLIVSSVIHYQYGSGLYAYGPYGREVDIWADLFPEVIIAAPCRNEAPPSDCLAFTRPNISMRPQEETGGKTFKAKARQLLRLPMLVWSLSCAMREADAIHVRCPGNLGLLGTILAPVFSSRLIAKYAGQWVHFEGEPWTVRLQRALLCSPWWRGPVTVYGRWPNQPPQVVPFFTSMMTAQQVDRAASVAATKDIALPLHVLFSGRLVPDKRVDALLTAAKIAVEGGLRLEVAIIGDGPEQEKLRRQVIQLGLQECVKFVGALPFESALEWYEWGHCLVLPSESEGWPKVIAEGMCYGLICIAMERGQVPTMLMGRGILLKTGKPQEIADALQRVAHQPDQFQPVMREASIWARQYSLEGLREALAELLAQRWNIPRHFLKAQPSNG